MAERPREAAKAPWLVWLQRPLALLAPARAAEASYRPRGLACLPLPSGQPLSEAESDLPLSDRSSQEAVVAWGHPRGRQWQWHQL